MAVFYYEQPQQPSKRCRFLSLLLNYTFSICQSCNQSLSTRAEDEDTIPMSEIDDEEEIVSTIISRAMEAKVRRRSHESFSTIFNTYFGDSFATTTWERKEDNDGSNEEMQHHYYDETKERDDFLSAASHFSNCSSAVSAASEFFSVNTSFPPYSSLKGLEFVPEIQRRSIFEELCNCEGWPFGLCRRALLLPPLPKSPSESWSWCKSTKITTTGYVCQKYHKNQNQSQ